ncbi:hypothetical protein MATL_G00129490 [Megalops atlanticus]|uniref:Transmembrane protein 79 n=1 Tax=Megalops atlanticus TaxID=7932 RepID=A0A9D3PZZ9_MEGAT|nr:hypothetical protein MATL_G00129490 [Megalops atlanticus]
MSEILSTNLEPGSTTASKTNRPIAEPQTLGRPEQAVQSKEEEDGGEEEKVVSSAAMESSTLPLSESKGREKMSTVGNDVLGEGGGVAGEKETQGERGSMDSGCTSMRGRESRTESERELGGREREPEEGWDREMSVKERGKMSHLDLGAAAEGDDLINSMPEKAAQVFSPRITILNSSSKHESHGESVPLWEGHTEKSPFLGPHGTPPDGYYHEWPVETPKCACSSADRDALKVGVSVFMAALIFPLLVWGGYVFLPFDAPLLHASPQRLIYTLRCSVFATVPIVLGVLVLGVSRLRFCSVKPRCEGEAEGREVSVHRQYVSDSLSLFLLYFLQLAVMATYLSQETLKLVPLLTIIFAFGRLIYWASVTMGSSVRGVGFGFSFLPTLAMLGANLYFIFTMDSGGSIFALEDLPTPEPPSNHRQRFWG